MSSFNWQVIVDNLAQSVLVLDQHLRVVWLNDKARQCFKDPTGKLLDVLLASRQAEGQELLQGLTSLASGESICWSPIPLHSVQGLIFLSEIVATRMPTKPADAAAYILLVRDITAEHSRLAELQLSARVFECSGEAILITDSLDRILAANQAFGDLTGYSIEEILGRNPEFLRWEVNEPGVYEEMWNAVKTEGQWKGEVHQRRPSGEIYAVWLTLTAERDLYDNVSRYISIFSDITERKAREEHIRRQAEHDYLTGLPNRVLLQDRFSQAVANRKRQKSSQIALAFVDLDGFKAINDEAGHGVGDQLLKIIAGRLEKYVRATDSVCRYGGDEFVILMTNVAEDLHNLNQAFEKILECVGYPITVEGQRYEVSASIGVALYQLHGTELDTLLKEADKAMYKAKANGKTRWVLADPDA